MENDVIIDQSVLAEDVSSKIPYEFLDMFLVKPLDAIKVKKEFSEPVAKTQAQKDTNDIVAADYEEVKTEVKEVDSDYRKGVVLKVPYSYEAQLADTDHKTFVKKINVGDIVLFRDRAGAFFDLLKDSKMIRYYDIVAIETK